MLAANPNYREESSVLACDPGPEVVLSCAPGVRMWVRKGMRYLCLLKGNVGCHQLRNTHSLLPLSPPCLALSEGFAYLSAGGREGGSWEVGSRESNYGRVRARFLPGKGWARGVQSNTRTGQVHPGCVSTFLTAFPHRVPTHSVLSPRPP